MFDDMNFGQPSNNKVCSCGRHHGVGEWPPEQRAAFYKRMQDRMPGIMKPDQVAYLSNWENHHGFVRYRMDVVGKNSGLLNKFQKGHDVIGPVFIDPNSPMEMPDMFDKKPEDPAAARADIHG